VRGLLWDKSWKLIKQNPLIGWGYYSAHDHLRNEYTLSGFEEGVKQNYNSHNQYLFSWLCFGIAGLVLLVAFNLQFLLICFRKKEFLGVYIMLLFIMAMMTDCMLEIQKGIVFLMMFGGIFVFNAYALKERVASA
jgi:O-antigen ligase